MKRKSITLSCDYCGNSYEKPESEYKRNLKLNRKNYCSRSCVAKDNNSKKVIKNRYDVSQHCNNKGDEFTPYRYTIRNIKRRSKEFDLSLEDLKEIWLDQKGVCPYSGISLELPTYTKPLTNELNKASLDRIDSSKGYIKENVQFVAYNINLMKSTLSHEDTINLCKQISKNYVPPFDGD